MAGVMAWILVAFIMTKFGMRTANRAVESNNTKKEKKRKPGSMLCNPNQSIHEYGVDLPIK